MLLYFLELIKQSNKKNYYENLHALYNSKIMSLNSFILFCPKCLISKDIIKYGFYYKNIISFEDCINKFRIQRIMCKDCECTSSIFPDDFIPYSPVPVSICIEIIIHYLEQLEEDNGFYNNIIFASIAFEKHYKSIIKKYNKYWKHRLKAMQIDIYDDDLSLMALEHFNLQFMQIKKIGSGSFALPT